MPYGYVLSWLDDYKTFLPIHLLFTFSQSDEAALYSVATPLYQSTVIDTAYLLMNIALVICTNWQQLHSVGRNVNNPSAMVPYIV